MIRFFEKHKYKIENKVVIKKWLKSIAEKHHFVIGDINYILCDDLELLEINQSFLKHDTFTDIITFNYNQNHILNSDIYISIERIQDNAKLFKVAFTDELYRVMIHGVLHLCGFNDKTKNEKIYMRSLEDEALKILNKK